ncbi:MAG: SGNH/GDSL hydrolase family protein [Anaerolineae bacterium]
MLVFLVAFLGIGLCLLCGVFQTRYQRLQRAARGLMITYVTIGVMFAAGESYFRFVFAESDGLPTLASQNWLARYWQKNTLGYRDPDWQSSELVERKTILIIGDSFAAGWGLESVDDRFGNVLGSKLGDRYAVINMGKPGASTTEEIDSLQESFVPNPDVVILQYYLNDIENAALSIGLDPGLDPSRGMPPWASESYLGNFIYWRLVARFRPEQQGTQPYWNWLYSMYDNATVWDIHRQQLESFVDVVENKGALLIVVIFPNMLDPVSSIPYVDRVAQALAARGYDDAHVLKLFDVAEAMPLQERVVSGRDAHASASFNRAVGEMLNLKLNELMNLRSAN